MSRARWLSLIFLLLWPLMASAAGKKKKKGSRGPERVRSTHVQRVELDLAVLARRSGKPEMHLLWLSSRAFARNRIRQLDPQRGILVELGPARAPVNLLEGSGSMSKASPSPQPHPDLRMPSSLLGPDDVSAQGPSGQSPPAYRHKVGGRSRTPDAAKAPEAPSINPAGRTQAGVSVQAWVDSDPVSAYVGMAAAVTVNGQAGYRGPECSDCELRVEPGFVIAGRGIPESVTASVLSQLKAHRGDPVEALLRLATQARQFWPSRGVIRSALFYTLSPDAGERESLVIDADLNGRANEELPKLHAWHEGDVRGPENLAIARQYAEQGNQAGRVHAASKARGAMRKAIASYSRVPLWHARLALALTLEHPGQDSALVPLRKALYMAPKATEIRLLAAEVMWWRGESGQARVHLGEVLRLDPEHVGAKAWMAKLATGHGPPGVSLGHR